jgi:hypothetical protein
MRMMIRRARALRRYLTGTLRPSSTSVSGASTSWPGELIRRLSWVSGMGVHMGRLRYGDSITVQTQCVTI